MVDRKQMIADNLKQMWHSSAQVNQMNGFVFIMRPEAVLTNAIVISLILIVLLVQELAAVGRSP